MLCSATTRTGQPCKAQALPGRTTCVAHSSKPGAPPGNKNAARHGYYTVVTEQDIKNLEQFADEAESLTHEINTVRVVLDRVLTRLNEDDNIENMLAMVKLLFDGSSTIARLLRSQHALRGKAADGISAAIDQALNEISTAMGIEL